MMLLSILWMLALHMPFKAAVLYERLTAYVASVSSVVCMYSRVFFEGFKSRIRFFAYLKKTIMAVC